MAQLEAEKEGLLEALRACQQHLRAQDDTASAAAARAAAEQQQQQQLQAEEDEASLGRSQVVVVSARPTESLLGRSYQPVGGGGGGSGGGADPTLKQRLQQLKTVSQGRGASGVATRRIPPAAAATAAAAAPRVAPGWDQRSAGHVETPRPFERAGDVSEVRPGDAGADVSLPPHSARSTYTTTSTASGASWLPLRPTHFQPQQQPQSAAAALPPRPPASTVLGEQQHLQQQGHGRPPEQRRASAASSTTSSTGAPPPHQSHSTPEVRDANHRRVWAALSTVLLAGPALADRLRGARAALEASTDKQVVVLVASSGGRGRGGGAYHGLYAVLEDPAPGTPGDRQQPHAGPPQRDPAAVLAIRIHGTGPPVLSTAMITTLFKFDPAARELREVGSSHTFTFTTDAVGVDAAHLGTAGRA